MTFPVVYAPGRLRRQGFLQRAAGGFLALLFLASAAAQEAEVKQAALQEFNVAATLQNSGLYSRAAEKWERFL